MGACIKANGLRPGQDSQYNQSLLRPGHVYLCTRKTAYDEVELGIAGWGDAIISVDIRKLKIELINSDEDYWRDGDKIPSGHWKEVLAYYTKKGENIDEPARIYQALSNGGTCAYRGVITPNLLRLEHFPADRTDVERPGGW